MQPQTPMEITGLHIRTRVIVLEDRGKFQNPSTAAKETNAHYTSDSVRRGQAQCWHQVPFLLLDNNQNGCDHKNNLSGFCVTEKMCQSTYKLKCCWISTS